MSHITYQKKFNINIINLEKGEDKQQIHCTVKLKIHYILFVFVAHFFAIASKSFFEVDIGTMMLHAIMQHAMIDRCMME